MPDLVTAGFHHLTLVTRDARRAVSFYRDVLGLALVKKTVNFDDPGSYHLYFGDGAGRPGTLVTFFEWPETRKGGWGVGGIHHLALGTADRETQLMWKRRLQDAGVGVAGPYDRGYFTSIYFQDPDGQVLEIATDGPGYAIDEPADALGRTLVRPDPERLPDGRDEAEIQARVHPDPVPEVTDAMRLSGIHHVTGITDDLETADAFLTRALGLRLIKKTLNQDDAATKHYFWARYQDGRVTKGSAYTLFGWPGSTHRARPGAGQTHHIAFRARDRDELEAWRAQVGAAGTDVTPILDRTYFKSIYFRAPDGQLLEVATDEPGFAVDEAPDALGRELCLPPWLEERREQIKKALTPLG